MFLPFFIYYYLILYRKCNNQIYLCFIHVFKILFEKIFISVLTHDYALTLTFLFYSSPVC
ncbi:hypothetical protein SEEM0420_009605 [Salmonella enterica subsp. enterica serovar Muenster str. 420]|nr:hypothetical protein SEEM0315_009820 [Salmonella enterica subsp. enterica serovar Muenster str. 0315]AUM49491.1 hypothetical protein SEEM0420_009605 [Salmonella enterica subsp. enterica serovar Muenster str. 420]